MSAETIRLRAPLIASNNQLPQHKLATAYSLFKELKLILILLKLFGLLPIFKVGDAFELAPSKCKSYATLYTIFMRIFALIVVIAVVYMLYTPTADSMIFIYGEMDNATKAVNILLIIATYAVIMWMSVLRSKHFILIINKLLRVDEELQLHPRSPTALQNNCSFYKRYIYLVLLHTSTICVLKWLSVNTCTSSVMCVVLHLIYFKQMAVINGYIIFVAVLLHLLAMRFQYLNNFIQAYTIKENAYENVPQQMAEVSDAVTECERKEIANGIAVQYFPIDALFFYRIHSDLLALYKMLNDCVHIALLFYIGTVFYTSTLSAYEFYFAAKLHANVRMKTVIWCCISMSLFVPVAALLMYCCDAATKEANDTASVLARIYGRDTAQQRLIDKFLSKNIKQDVQFTAYGFFAVDKSTLFKICSAITTYLVILIQFRQLEDSRA